MTFYNKNNLSNKVPLLVYTRVLVSLILLILSVTATALSCPGPQDFAGVSSLLWGWSWELNPDRIDDGDWVKDASLIEGSLHYTSPAEQAFSPNFSLNATLYFIRLDQTAVTATVRLDCDYKLAKGHRIMIKSLEKHISIEELSRLPATHWKPSPQTQRLCNFDGYLCSEGAYQCSATAGTADQCNVNLT